MVLVNTFTLSANGTIKGSSVSTVRLRTSVVESGGPSSTATKAEEYQLNR